MTGPEKALHGSADLDLAALNAWGERFGASLTAPALVTLAGELGAGKTTLAQAICRGCGVTEPVTSPTFALVHEYRTATAPVFHLDLFRIGSTRELASLGWDEILGGNAVVLLEWPERAGTALPAPSHAITLAHLAGAPDRRRIAW